MRPRGEIRRALGDAAWQVARERHDGGTYRDLAARACVGFKVAKQYCKDMARAGELSIAGQRQVPGSVRPANCYVPAGMDRSTSSPDIQTVMRGWVGAR